MTLKTFNRFLFAAALLAAFIYARQPAKSQNSSVVGAGRSLIATATLDFANQAAIGCNDLTVSVPGASLSDVVSVGTPNGGVPSATAIFSGWVSSANTVTVRFCALVSGDPASSSFTVGVLKP